MIKSSILNRLSEITREEQNILSGDKNIERSFYMSSDDNIINNSKFLSAGIPIAMRPHTRFVHFPKHSHDYIEIVYMCSGHTTHIIDGKTLILSECDILIMGTGVTHEILPTGKNDLAVNFIVHPDFFKDIINTFSIKMPPNPETTYFSVPDLLTVHNLAENLIWLLISPDVQNIRQYRFTLGLLLMTLLKGHHNYASLENVFSYIEENYKDGSLCDLAERLHYDLSWLSREIKTRTGKTYTDFVQEKRLSHACFLLRNTDMNISDISIAVGYNNISYFHRLFNKYFGISPRKYRMLP